MKKGDRQTMRNFIRYLLAFSVLAMGFYGASQHRLSDEQANLTPTFELEQLVPAAVSDPAPQIPATARRMPLAALIDTDRTLVAEPPVDPRATLKTLPEIARREPIDSPSVSAENRNRDEESPPKRRAKSSPTAKAPTSLAEHAVPEISPKKSSNFEPMEEVANSRSTQDLAERRPADEPRSLASLASRNVDSPNLPLPKLDPRPGTRFALPDPPERNSSTPAPDETDPWDWMTETKDPGDEQTPELAESDPRPAPEEEKQESTATIHTIEIGDTLPKLAERYLGSREQYEVIYRANADILGDPRLLPIGLRIKIPTRSAPAANADCGIAQTPLPEKHDDPLDELFAKPAQPNSAGSDLVPIPPQALPPHQYGTWQYSVR
jgi:nucleoid-associated protein YgaU